MLLAKKCQQQKIAINNKTKQPGKNLSQPNFQVNDFQSLEQI